MEAQTSEVDVPIKDEDIQRAKNMARAIAKNSEGFMSERQALASILFRGKPETMSFLDEELDGRQVAEIMGISRNSVYKAAKSGSDKMMAAKIMVDIAENEPWWAVEARLDTEE